MPPSADVMTITEAAATRVKEILASRSAPSLGLRIGVKARGCSGLSYTIDYADELKPGDQTIEDKGATVIIDAAATLFLVGTEMDYVDNQLQAGFVFRNPNEKARCGCGESFSV